ncbi:hypothetical protein [Mesorhizobium sp. M0491]|uniref:hypothetical protein n=1 Tax=Mesorhizobium sp. M0491 TaxID=2956950 RepID=UPI0033390309
MLVPPLSRLPAFRGAAARKQEQYGANSSLQRSSELPFKLWQNLLIKEFEPAGQHFGIGGICVDIDRYQFRYRLSAACSFNPDFKGTDIPI